MQRHLYNFLNRLLNICVVLAVAVTVLYCAYSIWDNNSVYSAAESFMAEIQKKKPSVKKPSFDDLLKINKDVCGWVTLKGTKIDTPVVQGKDNEEYLNKSVYGSFSLAGCPYLDVRCKRDFSDPYNIIYGHHMDRHQMFGDLDLYKKASFFKKYKDGYLLIPGKKLDLTVLAILEIDASDSGIYDTELPAEERYQYVQNHSLHINHDELRQAEQQGRHLLVLSTCASGDGSGRTVLLLSYE